MWFWIDAVFVRRSPRLGAGAVPSLKRNALNPRLEKVRPVLASNKKPVPRRIISDAIEHRLRLRLLLLSDRRKINPGPHLPRPRINPRNSIRVPHVRIDVASGVDLAYEIGWFRLELRPKGRVTATLD